MMMSFSYITKLKRRTLTQSRVFHNEGLAQGSSQGISYCTLYYPHLSSCVYHIGIAAPTSFQSIITIILFSVANGLASKWKTDDHSQIVGILVSIGIIDGTDFLGSPSITANEGVYVHPQQMFYVPFGEPPSVPYFLLARSQQIMQHRQWPTRCETKGIIDKMWTTCVCTRVICGAVYLALHPERQLEWWFMNWKQNALPKI